MLSKERIVLVKGMAGLGNRILALLTALLYAKLSNRKIYVDWSDDGYSSDGSNAFSSFFHGPNFNTNFSDITETTDSINPEIWKNNLKTDVHTLVKKSNFNKFSSQHFPWFYRNYSIDLSNLDHKENIVIYATYTQKINKLRKHLLGEHSYLEKKSNEEILKILIHEELILKNEIREKIDNFKTRYFSRPIIGVHIRHTDRKSPLEKYHKTIRGILKKTPHAQIFLSTDNFTIQKQFSNIYANVISTSKWLPKNEERIHYNKNSPNATSVGIDALIDMYLLSECDFLVHAGRSTFSKISCLATKLPASKIYDIDKFNLKVRLRDFSDNYA